LTEGWRKKFQIRNFKFQIGDLIRRRFSFARSLISPSVRQGRARAAKNNRPKKSFIPLTIIPLPLSASKGR
jgi:hypothetical protein